MRVALAALSLLLAASSIHAADPVYLDQLIETPLSTLQAQFPGLRKEGCYRIGADRFLLINVDAKKEHKPCRIAVTSIEPCRRPNDGPELDVRERTGVQIGENTLAIVQRMGRPDASAPPETTLKQLGDTEYFYICRIEEGCARHTSFYIRDGVVTGIAEWYSE